MTRLFGTALVLAWLAAGSQQTGSISGYVVSDDGRPAPRAEVVISPLGGTAGSASTVSDDTGRFTFDRLPAGRYTIRALKPTFIDSAYGAAGVGRPGKPIPLAAGQILTNLRIPLPRGAVMSGTLRDSNGEPAPNVRIQAIPVRTRAYGRIPNLSMPGTMFATSDLRGGFRFYGLAASDYVVVALPILPGPPVIRRITPADIEAALSGTSGASRPSNFVGYVPTYYPGTTQASQAAIVPVSAGTERGGVDFSIQFVPFARVEGVITNVPTPPSGQQVVVPVQLLAVELDPLTALVTTKLYTAGAVGNGRFAFEGIPPGKYALSAEIRGFIPIQSTGAAARPGITVTPGDAVPIQFASAEVQVDSQDITNLSVALQPGITLSGRVTFEGSGSRPDPRNAQLTIGPVRAPYELTTGRTVVARPDRFGNFTLPAFAPGRYRLTASPVAVPSTPPVTWSVRSVTIAGRDTADSGFDFAQSQELSDVAVVFSARASELIGVVQSSTGEPSDDCTVIAFSTDRSDWAPQSRRIAAVQPDGDGRFVIRNLPAGNYFLIGLQDVVRNEWLERAFLEAMAPLATRITIAEGEKRFQPVRLGVR